MGITEKDDLGNVTKIVEYAYDPLGRRISKHIDNNGDGDTTDGGDDVDLFFYDGQHIALKTDESGNAENRYLHGPAIDMILADEDATGEVLWAATDHLGSVTHLLDFDGTSDTDVVATFTYDAFGKVVDQTGTGVDFIYGWTGREVDAESDEQYNRARYYDADIGRWLSQDPISFAAGDENLYRYVGNGPTSKTDPSGLEEYHVQLPLPDGGSKSVPIPEHLRGLYDRFRSEVRSRGPYGPLTSDQTDFIDKLALGGTMDFWQDYVESQQSYVGPNPNPPQDTDSSVRRPTGHEIAEDIIESYVDHVVYETTTVWNNTEHFSYCGRVYTTVGTTAGTFFGVRGVSDLFSEEDAVDGHTQSWQERANDGIFGAVSLGTAGFGGAKLLSPTGGGTAGIVTAASDDAISYSMRDVRQRWWNGRSPVRANPDMPRGREYMELSHTYISNNGAIGKYIPERIKNRGWNLKPMWGSEHALVDPHRYRFMSRTWKANNSICSPPMRLWGRMPASHRVTGGVIVVTGAGYGAYALMDGDE